MWGENIRQIKCLANAWHVVMLNKHSFYYLWMKWSKATMVAVDYRPGW